MLRPFLQKCHGDSKKSSLYQLPEAEPLSLSENSECDSTSPADCLELWRQPSSHVVLAVFLCLGLRALLNAVTGVTFLAVLNGQVVQQENGSVDFVRYLEWERSELAVARTLYWYGVPLAEVWGSNSAARGGHPKLFGVGATITSVLALITPAMLHASCTVLAYFLVAARLIDAFLVHNMELVWGNWVPLHKRWLVAFSYSGIVWGSLMSNLVIQLIPNLITSPLLFYILGSCGCVMCILWWVALKKVPIESSVSASPTQGRRLSFCQVIVSLPVFALLVAVQGNFWSYITLDTSLTRYSIDVLGYEDGPPEYLSLGQHLVTLLVLYVFIFISTIEVSTKVVQKSYVCATLAVNGMLLFLVPYVYSATGVMAIATAVHICSAIAYNSSLVNVLDIAPKYSPVIIGLLMAVGSVCAPLAPSVVEFVTQDHIADEWKKVFFISGGSALGGAFTYLIFGKVKLQKWATDESTELQYRSQEA